jgi:hypothetical protein
VHPHQHAKRSQLATGRAERDQTCHHKLRIARHGQIEDFRSSRALETPLGTILVVPSIVLLFTVALHEPVRLSKRMQPKTIAISGSIERR